MFEKLLEKLAIIFSKNHIPYMIIGGQAVLLYGEPRSKVALTSPLAFNCPCPKIKRNFC